MTKQKALSVFLALTASAALAGIAAAQQYKPPLYHAARAQDDIRVDGKLDEFTWAALPRVGRFTDIRRPDNPDAAPTQATVAWDGTNLYIAFACVDPEPWGTMMQHDQHLWNEEVVEVFLDPDGDGQNYPELEVSPHNVVVDKHGGELTFETEEGVGTTFVIRLPIEGARRPAEAA